MLDTPKTLEELRVENMTTHRIDEIRLSLCAVDLVAQKAWVINGCYWIHWDDSSFYAREPDGFLHWMSEKNGAEIIKA